MANSRRQFWGQIVYERVGDGCFNGLWNNNDRNNEGRILNEIARKRDGKPDIIEGTYVSSWIERNNEPVNALLVISRINRIEYSFQWNEFESGVSLFQGVGMEIGLNYVVVSYWFSNADSLILST